jgi:hypothetical protein
MNEGANFMDIPEDMHKINAIPLGKNNGVLCFNKMVASKNDCMKDKMDLRDRFIGVLRNE